MHSKYECGFSADDPGGDLEEFLLDASRTRECCEANKGNTIPLKILYGRADPNAHFTHASRTAPRDND